ncbi:MAG: hypothetical protein H6713_12155 [Myxococcales bacterium]|nr:hypothetical protein [Myxococcales bacterium]
MADDTLKTKAKKKIGDLSDQASKIVMESGTVAYLKGASDFEKSLARASFERLQSAETEEEYMDELIKVRRGSAVEIGGQVVSGIVGFTVGREAQKWGDWTYGKIGVWPTSLGTLAVVTAIAAPLPMGMRAMIASFGICAGLGGASITGPNGGK